MDKNPQNAIQRARLSKGLTQEALAERIGYSPDSVRAWENGTRIASLEALDALTVALDASWLSGIYMREQTAALNALLPDFEVGKPLAQAVAGFITAVLDLMDVKADRKLLQMVADGRIDAAEQTDFDCIMDLAEKVNKAYFEVRFAAKEQGR